MFEDIVPPVSDRLKFCFMVYFRIAAKWCISIMDRRCWCNRQVCALQGWQEFTAQTEKQQQLKAAIAAAHLRQVRMDGCFAAWLDVSSSQHSAKLHLIKLAKQHDAAIKFCRLYSMHQVKLFRHHWHLHLIVPIGHSSSQVPALLLQRALRNRGIDFSDITCMLRYVAFMHHLGKASKISMLAA